MEQSNLIAISNTTYATALAVPQLAEACIAAAVMGAKGGIKLLRLVSKDVQHAVNVNITSLTLSFTIKRAVDFELQLLVPFLKKTRLFHLEIHIDLGEYKGFPS